MAETFGLTAEGIEVPRLADYLAAMRDEFVALTGQDVDWERDTFLGQITALEASRLDKLSELVVAIYDAVDVNNAVGIGLSNLALIVGVTRNVATKSRADLTLSGTAGTVVPSGKVVSGGGDDGAARWVLLESVTLAASPVTVAAEAELFGAVLAPPGEIDTIVTPVSGWSTVTNAAAAIPGVDEETDAELRVRRQRSLQISGGRSLNAIRANLLELPFLTGAAVIDNPQSTAQVVAGISLPPHSLHVAVFPTSLTDDEIKQVARVIYDLKAEGIETFGLDVNTTVVGLDGFEKPINFAYGDPITVNVATTVTLFPGFVLGDVVASVQEAVAAYFATLQAGDDVLLLDVYGAISVVEGVRGATVLLNGVGADFITNVRQLAVLGTNTVS